jgi:hypothetical protein
MEYNLVRLILLICLINISTYEKFSFKLFVKWLYC